MNTKLLLVGGMVALVLAGCQNMEDQMGAKLAETLINSATNGEVKVSIEDLESGKMNITTKEGTMSIDGDENSLSVTDTEGNTERFVTERTETRPAIAEKDLPSLERGKNFSYFGFDEMSNLNYELDGLDVIGSCTEAKKLVEAEGWKALEDGFNVELEDFISVNYSKGDFELLLTCQISEGMTSIGMQKLKSED